MRAFLLLVACLSVACADYSGATYAVNGGNKTSEYRARTFITDLQAGSFTAKKAIVAGQNQSKTPIAGLQVAGMLGGGMITAGVSKARDAGDAAAAINASKQATKQAGIAADVAKTGIAAETTKAITIPK